MDRSPLARLAKLLPRKVTDVQNLALGDQVCTLAIQVFCLQRRTYDSPFGKPLEDPRGAIAQRLIANELLPIDLKSGSGSTLVTIISFPIY